MFHCFAQRLRRTGRILELGGTNVGNAFPQLRLRRVGLERLFVNGHRIRPLALHFGAQAGIGDGLRSHGQRRAGEKSQGEYPAQHHLRHRRLRKTHRSAAKRPIVMRSNSSTA